MPNSLKSPDLFAKIMDIVELYAGKFSTSTTYIRDDLKELLDELSRAPIAEWGGLREAANSLKFDLYELTTPELRAAFGGVKQVAVVQPDTLKTFRAAIESLSRQGGEAVAWQGRFYDDVRQEWGEWRPMTESESVTYAGIAGWETRGLFTRASDAGDWVLVPKEPTSEMMRSGAICREAVLARIEYPPVVGHRPNPNYLAGCTYEAMIAAAPAPGGG